MSTKVPTLQDVALRAGVSVATVSRVLRGYPHIADETRARVYREARLVGYQRSPANAQLQPVRTAHANGASSVPGLRRLQVLVDTTSEKQYAQTLLELTNIGMVRGFDTDVSVFNRGCLLERVAQIQPGDGDAITVITLDNLSVEDARKIQESPVPIVIINRYVQGLTYSVTLDDYAAGCNAANYLYGLGHRRIACLQGDLYASSMVDRVKGFREELYRLGAYEPSLFLETGGRNSQFYQRITECVKTLISEVEPVTAVWAWNDVAASAAIVAAHSMGVRTPEDISIIGFDAMGLESPKRLTTFEYSLRDLATCAVSLMEMRLSRMVEQPVRICVTPKLVVGDSTAPPPVMRCQGELALQKQA